MSPSKVRCARVVRVGSMQCDMKESFRLRKRTVMPAKCNGKSLTVKSNMCSQNRSPWQPLILAQTSGPARAQA